jgi:hypothetical protein
LDAPGRLRHAIVRGIEKRQVVDDVTDRKDFKRRLAELAVDTKTAIYTWAQMSNYAHILLRSSKFISYTCVRMNHPMARERLYMNPRMEEH